MTHLSKQRELHVVGVTTADDYFSHTDVQKRFEKVTGSMGLKLERLVNI